MIEPAGMIYVIDFKRSSYRLNGKNIYAIDGYEMSKLYTALTGIEIEPTNDAGIYDEVIKILKKSKEKVIVVDIYKLYEPTKN